MVGTKTNPRSVLYIALVVPMALSYQLLSFVELIANPGLERKSFIRVPCKSFHRIPLAPL
jgi:hypothetical protein